MRVIINLSILYRANFTLPTPHKAIYGKNTNLVQNP